MRGLTRVAGPWCAVALLACSGKGDLELTTARSALSGNVSTVKLLPACVTKTAATEWWATFGYESSSVPSVGVGIGPTNGFSPTPVDRGQPTRFDPGLHARAFSVLFDGKSLTWTLGASTVNATSASPACAPTTDASAPVLGQFVLYAQADIRMDRATVLGGDIGVVGINQMTDGRDEVSLEPDGRTDPNHGVFAHTVDLRARAVMGSIFTSRLDNQGGSVVSVGPFPSNLPAIPPIPAISSGTTAITVAAGKTTTLQPGAYGPVQVTGTLTLFGGTYQLASLDIWNAGRVEAAAGARLRIKGHLYVGPSAHLRTNPVGAARDLLIEVAGGDGATAVLVDSDAEIHALLTTPSGALVFHPRVSARGAFVAHDMQINADAHVTFEGGFPLPFTQCMAGLQLTAEQATPGQDDNTLPRMIAATACFVPDASTCEVSFIATVNFDQRSAAKQLMANLFTPSQYLWIGRDRSRKLRLAEKDPTWVAAFCRGDADGDLVPDDRDGCPGTPPLTATDDRGCTNATLPPGPSASGVQMGLAKAGLIMSLTCDGAAAPTPPVVTDVCFDDANTRYLITVPKELGQPDRCGVWYELMVQAGETFEARETFTTRWAFEHAQAVSQTSTSYTFEVPKTCDPTTVTPGSLNRWPCDQTDGTAFDMVIATRATNGSGQQSQWGTARRTLFHNCQ